MSLIKSGEEKTDRPNSGEDRRDAPRLTLMNQEALHFHLFKKGPVGGNLTLQAVVRNVSFRGARIVLSNFSAENAPQLGDRFLASAVIEGFSIPLELNVVRVGENGEVGVQFCEPLPAEMERLQKFLEPRFLGQSLREIDPSILQKTETGTLVWFQGVNDTELFFWKDENTGRLRSAQLVFLDRFVEWPVEGPARTGRIKDDGWDRGEIPGWVQTDLLVFDSAPEQSTVLFAKAVLESAVIDTEFKKELLQRI